MELRVFVLQALDQALASGRYDSWLPAVYVTQRWLVYAAMEGEYGPYDADSRAWAFEEESVRTNVLRLIDRSVAGDCFKNAPDWLRTWHTALFAVVALSKLALYTALLNGDAPTAVQLTHERIARALNALPLFGA